MNNKILFCSWLIDKLKLRNMSFQDICNEWEYTSLNYNNKEITLRTFHRYRKFIALLGYYIKYDRANRLYYIIKDPYVTNNVADRIVDIMNQNKKIIKV